MLGAGQLLALCVGGAVWETHNASYSGPVDPVAEVIAPYDGCACSGQAMKLAWSFDNQPEQWFSDTFIASRRGIYIWIANGAYGIRVGKDSHVVPTGFGWLPSEDDRRLIARAYDRWHDHVSLHAQDIDP
jgi:hypothetical protein